MLNLYEIDLKKEIEELKQLSGQERGADIKYLVNYVKKKESEEGLEELKAYLKGFGYGLPDIEKIGDIEWIPASLPTIFMLASAKFFNWQEKDIIEMGRNLISFSKLIKFFLKYFVSTKKTLEKGAQVWNKHYSFGQLKLVEYDGKKKTALARIKNFRKHPITCLYLQGVFSRIVEMATGSKQVIVKETKCIFRGHPYHEYVFKWQ